MQTSTPSMAWISLMRRTCSDSDFWQTSSASRSQPPVTRHRNRRSSRSASAVATRICVPGAHPMRRRKRSESPGELMSLLTPTRTAPEARRFCPRRVAVATDVPARSAISVQLARPSACRAAMILRSSCPNRVGAMDT